MTNVTRVASAVVALAAAAVWADEKPRMVVLDFQVAGDTDRSAGAALATASAEYINKLGFYSPVSSAELQSVLSVERQRQLLGGCSEDSQCLTELVGALGAPFLLSGSVARFGEAFQLTIQVIKASNAQVMGRSIRLSRDLAGVRALIPYGISEATGAPPPAPPSRVVPYTLMAGGGGVFLITGLIGLKGLTDQAELTTELSQASDLRTLPSYQQRASLVGTQKTIGLIGMIAGAGIATIGFLLNPPDLTTASAAVVPTPSGFAIVGIFP